MVMKLNSPLLHVGFGPLYVAIPKYFVNVEARLAHEFTKTEFPRIPVCLRYERAGGRQSLAGNALIGEPSHLFAKQVGDRFIDRRQIIATPVRTSQRLEDQVGMKPLVRRDIQR